MACYEGEGEAVKKLLILSGKGGTGKTTVACAFIHLLHTKTYADCDVDAPNLHLIAAPKQMPHIENFYGLPKANIDEEKCLRCGKCINVCRFDALSLKDKVEIDAFNCEGCGLCAYICPAEAITMEDHVSGQTYLYTGDTVFSTAKLKMGAGASGKLVAQVKKNMELSKRDEIAIIDGSPGIGCPVIASMSGVDMVLIITEPTVSGMSDLQRILETARYFKVKCAVCINKYDINLENTREITQYCEEENVRIVGTIPFDQVATRAINQGKSIVEMDCKLAKEMTTILTQTLKIMEEKTEFN